MPIEHPSNDLVLGTPIDLPCGRTLANRFAKTALYEALSDWQGGPPNEELYGLYRLWALGEWGMIITGGVQVSKEHLTMGRDIIVPRVLTSTTIEPYRLLASAIHTPFLSSRSPPSSSPNPKSKSALAIIQLAHSGRQSPRILGGRSFFKPPLGASNIPLVSRANNTFGKVLYKAMFAPPREANDEELEEVVESFVRGAELALKAGFDGCQLHCSHGYLLAQFMSPKTNTRPPPYGPPSSLYLLKSIIARIRALVPASFVLGVKLNASDYVEGGLSEDVALGQIRMLAELEYEVEGKKQKSVDFIEVSGGDYETPEFMGTGTSKRQAFFTTFARQALEMLKDIDRPPRIMLTGGFTTTEIMEETLKAHHTDIVGCGRAAIADPFIPRRLCASPSVHLPPSSTTTEPTEHRTLAPPPPKLRYNPPDQLANASLMTAQWTALMHRRATQGISLAPFSSSPSTRGEELEMTNEEWRLPLMRSEQHEPAIRSLFELVLRPRTIGRVVWGCWGIMLVVVGVVVGVVVWAAVTRS